MANILNLDVKTKSNHQDNIKNYFLAPKYTQNH